MVGVQLDLDTVGFSYQKWGAEQRCRPGDWLVNNAGEVYTINEETFAKTYRAVGQGLYEKCTVVWAEVATQAGAIATKEGQTSYQAGDYLVYNEVDGSDGYAVAAKDFSAMYEPAPTET